MRFYISIPLHNISIPFDIISIPFEGSIPFQIMSNRFKISIPYAIPLPFEVSTPFLKVISVTFHIPFVLCIPFNIAIPFYIAIPSEILQPSFVFHSSFLSIPQEIAIPFSIISIPSETSIQDIYSVYSICISITLHTSNPFKTFLRWSLIQRTRWVVTMLTSQDPPLRTSKDIRTSPPPFLSPDAFSLENPPGFCVRTLLRAFPALQTSQIMHTEFYTRSTCFDSPRERIIEN